MKNIITKSLSLICCLTLILSVLTVSASAEVMTTITFNIANDVGYNGSLDVHMTNQETGKEYVFHLNADNNYGKSGSYNIYVGTWNVRFDYENSDSYVIKNADGSDITTISPTTNAIALDWIISKAGDIQTNDINVNINSSAEKNNQLKKFLQATKFMDGNSNFDNFFLSISGKDLFIKMGYSENAWNNMSAYEKWSYDKLVLHPWMILYGENTDRYRRDLNSYIESLSQKDRLCKIEGGTDVHNACVEVWTYQYNTWRETGTFVNVFDNKKFGDTEEITTTRKSQELSSSSNWTNIFKKHWVEIILLVFFGGVVAYYAYKKKKEQQSTVE